MKKYLILLLALILCLPSCVTAQPDSKTSETDITQETKYGGTIERIDQPGRSAAQHGVIIPAYELQQKLFELLNSAKWEEGLTYSEWDYQFIGKDIDIGYISNDGVIQDLNAKMHAALSAKDQKELDKLIALYCVSNGTPSMKYEFEILQYDWSGNGVSTKKIEGKEIFNKFVYLIAYMEPTGEKAEKISNKSFDEHDLPLPAERGTKWISLGNALYRINPDMNEICEVESHYGGGLILNATDEFFELLRNTWYHYPYDSYSGRYKIGGDVPELNHLFEAESALSVKIKDINITTDANTSDLGNTITLEIISETGGEFKIGLDCYASDDNLALGESKTVTIKAGEAQTITLGFGGFPYDYWIMIKADNTKVEIGIEH